MFWRCQTLLWKFERKPEPQFSHITREVQDLKDSISEAFGPPHKLMDAAPRKLAVLGVLGTVSQGCQHNTIKFPGWLEEMLLTFDCTDASTCGKSENIKLNLHMDNPQSCSKLRVLLYLPHWENLRTHKVWRNKMIMSNYGGKNR